MVEFPAGSNFLQFTLYDNPKLRLLAIKIDINLNPFTIAARFN